MAKGKELAVAEWDSNPRVLSLPSWRCTWRPLSAHGWGGGSVRG